MLQELITERTIVLRDRVHHWKEAIRVAAEPLLKLGFIEQDYVRAMIELIENLGPYIVLTPHVAITHARPEAGVNRLSMSLLRLRESISFGRGKEVHLVIVLAAEDDERHLDALAELAYLIADERNIERLICATTEREIAELIRFYSLKEGWVPKSTMIPGKF